MKKWIVFGILTVVALTALIFTGVVLAQGPQGSERHLGYGRGHGYMHEDGDGMRGRFVDEDGDGVCDLRGTDQGHEHGRGFVDEDGDGVCDRFVDADGDGVCDLHGTGQGHGPGQGFVDGDGDGVCDHFGANTRMGQDFHGGRMGGRWSADQ